MATKNIKSFGFGETAMSYVKNSWWTLMVLAILITLLGLYAVFFPGATIELFVIFFGALLIGGGIVGVITSFIGNKATSGFSLAVSIVAFVCGILVVQNPIGFTEFLIFLIAVCLLVKSLLGLRLAISSKRGSNAWLIISGFLGIIASIFLFVYPTIGGIAILLVLGMYLIIFGIVSIIDLINVRNKFSKLIKNRK